MSKYQVGDVVRVRSGFTHCDATYVGDMKKYYGQDVTISFVSSSGLRYHIAEDPCRWWWSDDCFEDSIIEPETDISLEGLL